MSEEEHYDDIDISDVIEETEQHIDSENTENLEPDTTTSNIDSEIQTNFDNKATSSTSKNDINRLTRLPIARIKNIMRMDPDVNLINSDAAFLVTKATELFLETIAKETYAYTASKKKKIITKKDLDHVINVVDSLCFLDGALDF